MAPATKRCPACAEEIQAAARRCRYCGEVFGAGAPASPAPTRPAAKPAVTKPKPSSAGPKAIGCLTIVLAGTFGYAYYSWSSAKAAKARQVSYEEDQARQAASVAAAQEKRRSELQANASTNFERGKALVLDHKPAEALEYLRKVAEVEPDREGLKDLVDGATANAAKAEQERHEEEGRRQAAVALAEARAAGNCGWTGKTEKDRQVALQMCTVVGKEQGTILSVIVDSSLMHVQVADGFARLLLLDRLGGRQIGTNMVKLFQASSGNRVVTIMYNLGNVRVMEAQVTWTGETEVSFPGS